MGAKKREKRERIDPAPRLGMVLIRHSLGLFEQKELAAALGVAPSQVSMWESGDRDAAPDSCSCITWNGEDR